MIENGGRGMCQQRFKQRDPLVNWALKYVPLPRQNMPNTFLILFMLLYRSSIVIVESFSIFHSSIFPSLFQPVS